jgi:hypothetical protein
VVVVEAGMRAVWLAAHRGSEGSLAGEKEGVVGMVEEEMVEAEVVATTGAVTVVVQVEAAA